MDAQQLFWATGINNTALDTDAKAAVQIFSRLQKDVKAELEKIEKAYEATRMKTNLKFTNPVDPSMVESIKSQMRELGKVIDEQTKAVAGLSLSYDKAMQNINKATSRVGRGTGSGSPLQPTVDNVRSSVAQADRELSFLERRFKYAASSIVAYGSFRWGQQFIADMIKVKGEFDQLRVAIDSFTGSAEKGAQVFGQLTRLAVKSPFELRDITNSAKQLLAYGTAAEDVADSVKMLSDVSAGSGQSIKDIAYLYGTSLTQGRLYARDLFQFANRGIPIYGELAKVMGISTKELMEQVKIGKVGFPQLQAAMESMTAAGGKYFGLSDKIAATTFGKISNLKDKWSIALNEMGNATDGVVSTSVEGITVLLENWEQVVKAIGAAVAAYGSYKAATAVGALVAGVEAYASNYREAEALNILTTAQQRADLAKKGFVLGSVEYTAAIKAEAAAQLQNAQASVAAFDKQIVSLNALATAKAAELIESDKIVLLKKAELEASILLGNQKAIEAAKTNLSAAIGDKDTIASEANTLATELNTLMTEKQIVADKVELITTVQDTAAKAANTGSTNLLTAAKAKLTAMSARLNAVIAANPWTAAAIAIGALVYAIWQLQDNTTAAEKAQKRFDESMKRIVSSAEAEKAAFDELLNTVKNVNEAGDKRQRAYDKLKASYPDIIKNMTFENVVTANSVKLIKEHNEQLAYQEYIGKRVLEVQAKRALLEAKSYAESMKGTDIETYANKKYDEALEFYNLAKKEADDTIKAREEAAKRDKEKKSIRNKEFWETQKKDAEAALEMLTKADKGSKKWNELVAKIKEAERELKTWDLKEPKTKTDPVTTQRQKAEEMLAKIKENDAKLTDAAKQAEIDRQQAIIDEKADGHVKTLKQLELNYEKEKAKIKEESDKLLKIEQDTAYKRWLMQNPNWKKEKKTFAMPTTLSAESQGTISMMYGTANMNYLNSQKDMLQKMLIELGNFDEQRNEIDRKYNDQIEFLRKSRTENNKKEVDDAIAQAQRLAEEEKAKLSLEEFQKDINWVSVFENLDKVSTDAIIKLRDKIKNILSGLGKSLSKSDLKEVINSFNKLDDAIVERTPIDSLIDSYNKFVDSSKLVSDAQEKVNKLIKDGKKDTDEYKEAVKDLEKEQSKKNESAAILNKSIQATAKLGRSIVGASQDIMDTLSNFGVSMPESLEKVVSGIGKVFDGLESIDVTKPMTLITGSIKVMAGFSEAIAGIFGGKSNATKYYEELENTLGKYIDVLEQVIDSQKEAMDGMVGTAAIIASQKVTEAIEEEIESYRRLADAIIKSQLLKTGITNFKLKDYWDSISKSAGQTVDSVRDLYNLTPKQLQDIRDQNSYAWSMIDEEVRGYLDQIIEAGKELEDVLSDADEALTGLSFDTARDSLDDLLKDADTTFADVADNFEEYMRNAMLNMVKSKYLTDALTGWYSDFVDKTKSGNELTQTEVEQLRNAYMDIYKNAQSQYDALLDAADVQLTSSNNSTSGAISSMSQESADILTAQFSAIRINVSDILLTLQNQKPLLEMAFNDISEIAKNTRDLADIKKYLGYMWDQGLKIK